MSEPTMLLALYPGRADRELDAAVRAAVGREPDWHGEAPDGSERELAWEFPTRAGAGEAFERVSSGVSRRGLALRIRRRGV